MSSSETDGHGFEWLADLFFLKELIAAQFIVGQCSVEMIEGVYLGPLVSMCSAIHRGWLGCGVGPASASTVTCGRGYFFFLTLNLKVAGVWSGPPAPKASTEKMCLPGLTL